MENQREKEDMREIKFRGRTPKGQWVYGCFIHTGCDAPAIVWGDGEQAEIELETRSQYTGLKDKNGIEIYEGDVLGWDGLCFKVEFRTYFWEAYGKGSDRLGALNFTDHGIIVGNIHDNPELIKGDR